jgi:DNA-binding MarR family transcriptional regulator
MCFKVVENTAIGERYMTLEETLNELLVRLFKNLLEIEGKALITDEFKDISTNDMHIIEAVGTEEPRKMSDIAKRMSVTTGTLTKAMDALTEKGYVERKRSSTDKRVVCVILTDKGKRAYYHHEQFHRQMVEHIKEGLNEQETTVLIYALAKLADYFQMVYNDEDEESTYESWSNIQE